MRNQGVPRFLVQAAACTPQAWKRRPILWLVAAVLASCLLSILLLDRPLAEYYRHAADPEIVITFAKLSAFGDATPYIAIIVFMLLGLRATDTFALYQSTREKVRHYTNAGVFILLSLAASGAVIHILKIGIGRYRPRAMFEDGLYGLSPMDVGYLTSSFPSGHSQATWTLAAAMIIVFPRYDLLYILVAATVAYSRIVTGDHFLSDVIFGSFVGAVTPYLLKKFVYDPRDIPLQIALARDAALAAKAVDAGGQKKPDRRFEPAAAE